MNRKRPQAAKSDEHKRWTSYFSTGQVVLSCVGVALSVGASFFGGWSYLTRSSRVELSAHKNIEARWDPKDRRLSFDSYLLVDNKNGSASDTLHAVRADLRTDRGVTLTLGRIEIREIRDENLTLPTPFVVVREGQSLPVRLTVSLAQLGADDAAPLLPFGLYTLTVEFAAQTTRLAHPAQTYCFYVAPQAEAYLQQKGHLELFPDDRCAAGRQLADAQDVSRPVER